MTRTMVMLAAAALFTVVLILSFNLESNTVAPITDSEIHARFLNHRHVFETLRTLIETDGRISGIGVDYLSISETESQRGKQFWLMGGAWRSGDERLLLPEDELISKYGIDRNRFDTYRVLLDTIKAHRVIRADGWFGEGGISITITSTGNVASSMTKSVVYCPNGPPQGSTIAESTDGTPDESDWFVSLGDKWWIHCSRS